MKRAFAMVLAVTLFFSFAVVGQASVSTDKYYPVSYLYHTTSNNVNEWHKVSDGADVNGSPFYVDLETSLNTSWGYIQASMSPYGGNAFNQVNKPYAWFVFDWQFKTADNVNSGELVDVVRAASASSFGSGTLFSNQVIAQQYISHTEDGHWVAQVLCELPTSAKKGYRILFEVDGVITFVGSNSLIQTNAIYYQYADSASDLTPPLDPDNPYPSEPDGPMSPPTESDQWVSEQYSGAVNPDLAPKIEEAYSAAETVDTFEQDMWSELDKYSADVNPDNFTFDPQFISSMGWIASTWTDCFNGLGSWQSIITFPMFLGLAMLIIGRGSQAIDRGVAKHERAQRREIRARTDYKRHEELMDKLG